MAMDIHVGCSGWSYKHWKDDFYPKGLPQRSWFEHYASQFDTVELNTTFYRLPAEKTVKDWAREAPRGFRFAIKASRLITHYRRLKDCEAELETFFDRMAPLERLEGPILFQLPPQFERDDEQLRGFLRLLPAGHHHAFEFRHPSWWVEPVFELLGNRHAAFVMYDMGKTKTPVVATSAHAYLRFHGPERYSGGYSRERLRWWHEQLTALEASNAWVYFNNDIGGHAPRDAKAFIELGGA
jgi:uncharacterized protein YecE (DUF72 family)